MGLLQSKNVIFVTHQVEFLPSADMILVSYIYINISIFYLCVLLLPC